MTVPRWVTLLFRAAGLFTLFAVIGGSLVAATESGFECGNWPGCDVDAILPGGVVNEILYRNPWIEMTHRASAILSGPLALIAGIVALRMRNIHPLAKVLPWVTVVGAFIAGFVGRGIVLGEVYPTWVGALDLGAALVALVAMTTAAILVERTPAQWFSSRAGLFAWGAVGTLLVMHLTSLWAAGPGSYTRVVSWPVWNIVHADAHGSFAAQIARFPMLVLAVVLIVLAVREARALGVVVEGYAALAFAAACLLFGAIIGFTGTDALGVPLAMCAVGAFFTMTLIAARSSVLATATPSRGMTDTTPASEARGTARP